MTDRIMMDTNISRMKYETLRSLVVDNLEHFRKYDGKYNSRLVETFSQFLALLNAIEIETTHLSTIVHLYDLDANTPGNGYRSIISIVDTFLDRSTVFFQKVILRRRKFTFLKKRYFKEARAFTHLLTGLLALLRISQTLRSKNQPGVLFTHYDEDFLKRVITDMENVDRTGFYERLIAFQFDESLHKSLRFICLMTASLSHVYYASGGKFPRLCSALISFCRYSLCPSKLSKRYVKVVRNSSIPFCKTFWNLHGNDFVKKLTKSAPYSLAVIKMLKLQPEPLYLTKEDGTSVDIPIPSSHTPISPVLCKLLCACVREGQLDEAERMHQPAHAMKAASKYLIIYLYGSGYVMRNSANYCVYLNEWAIKLNAPVLCIEHSLAPEAPYLRALEECLYAYAWAIKNCHRLGSTCEKICVVGCSAGGDLITSLTIRAIQLGIRQPDGVVAVCPSNVTHYLPSPSNLLYLMDPLLPLEFSFSCSEAYIGDPCHVDGLFANHSMDDYQSLNVRVDGINRRALTNDPLKSPALASDSILMQFPPTRIVTTHADPILDHLVMFSRRIKGLGKDVSLDVLEKLPHGFLSFSTESQLALEGSRLCIQRIRDVLQMRPHDYIS